MTTNTLAWACMCMSLAQPSSDVLVTNQRSLSIPVNIQESRRAELRELVLYASNDQGRTWQQVATMLPAHNAFTFTAPLDGAYWLRVAAVNRLGKQEPENIYQGPPDQRVTIDTMKPLLRLKAPERQGDDILLAWELQEDNPSWSTFRLEYQPKDGGAAWTPITATPGLTGQARFRPTTQGPIAIRLSFTDQAGNQSFIMAEAAGTIAPAAFTSPQATIPSSVPAAPPVIPVSSASPLPPVPGDATALPPPAPVGETAKFPLPKVEAPRVFPTDSAPPAAAPLAASQAPAPGSPVPVAPPWNASSSRSDGKVVASSSSGTPAPVAPAPVAAPPRQLPLLQYVNHPEVTLEYELNRVGPSGVGSIDLWWTQNDGQTWELYAIDPEGKSGNVRNGPHKRTVELPGDGLFGFALVVKSKAGLGKAPPRAGDVPDIRFEVDTRAPVVDLYHPKPDPRKANALILEWSARDSNLANAPIQLEWAAKREGPWHAITTAPLPNTGKHTWPLPDNLPVQVYLRIRVRDLAGNESVAVTNDPQLVDLSEPEGKLVNVSVQPR